MPPRQILKRPKDQSDSEADNSPPKKFARGQPGAAGIVKPGQTARRPAQQPAGLRTPTASTFTSINVKQEKTSPRAASRKSHNSAVLGRTAVPSRHLGPKGGKKFSSPAHIEIEGTDDESQLPAPLGPVRQRRVSGIVPLRVVPAPGSGMRIISSSAMFDADNEDEIEDDDADIHEEDPSPHHEEVEEEDADLGTQVSATSQIYPPIVNVIPARLIQRVTRSKV